MRKRKGQHRTEKESPVRERNVLRSENRVLKRHVARLQKQLKKQIEVERDIGYEMAEEQEFRPPEVFDGCCSECGGQNLGVFVVPFSGKRLVACRDCKARLKAS